MARGSMSSAVADSSVSSDTSALKHRFVSFTHANAQQGQLSPTHRAKHRVNQTTWSAGHFDFSKKLFFKKL